MKRLLLLVTAAACRLGAQSSAPSWTLSSRPTLDIGSESNTQTQFNEVTGILRMPAGEIIVANGTSQELRVFTPAGVYLRTLTARTRSGVTMRSIDRIWRGTADTTFAAEILPGESAVWVFTLSGPVATVHVGASNAGGVYPVDRFPDGRLVVSAASRRLASMRTAITFVDSAPIGILSPGDRSAPRWIAQRRTQMFMDASYGRGRGRANLEAAGYPFGRSTSFAVSGDRLWIGDAETGTIIQYNSAGRGLAVVSPPIAPRSLDTALIRRVRSNARDWSDANRWATILSIPLPSRAPRFQRFLPGTDGEMWIELFQEDPSAPRRYVILDAAGSLIGRVTMPSRMVPMEVGSRDVMGVLTDDDGLEHVVRYALRRNSR